MLVGFPQVLQISLEIISLIESAYRQRRSLRIERHNRQVLLLLEWQHLLRLGKLQGCNRSDWHWQLSLHRHLCLHLLNILGDLHGLLRELLQLSLQNWLHTRSISKTIC